MKMKRLFFIISLMIAGYGFSQTYPINVYKSIQMPDFKGNIKVEDTTGVSLLMLDTLGKNSDPQIYIKSNMYSAAWLNATNIYARSGIYLYTKSVSTSDTIAVLDGNNLKYRMASTLIDTTDYVRVYTNQTKVGNLTITDTTKATKAVKSPYVIGGDATTSDLYLQTTTASGTTGADMHFLVGNNGAKEALTLLNNADIGGLNLKVTSDASHFVRIGSGAGVYATGTDNVAIGYNSAASSLFSASNNVSIGAFSMSAHRDGDYNTAIGAYANYSDYFNHTYNTYVGALSNYYGKGNYNCYFGGRSGYRNDNGENNVVMGYKASASENFMRTNASNNVIIGYEAGYDSLGNNNVLIGYQAGKKDNPNKELIIESSDSTNSLICGDFAFNRVGINTNKNNLNATLYVNGDGHFTGNLDVDDTLNFGGATYSGTTDITALINRFHNIPDKVFTDGVSDTLLKIAIPSDTSTYGNSISGTISYSISVKGSDGYQNESGIIILSALRYIGILNTDGTSYSISGLSKSSGTLTNSISITYGSGFYYVHLNLNSSLTTPVIKFTGLLTKGNSGTITNL